MIALDSPRSKEAAEALRQAESWIGTPYRHQGRHRQVGCDCLGLVLGVWRALYGETPVAPRDYAMDWAEMSADDPLLDAAHRHCLLVTDGVVRPGDLLLFRWRPGTACKHLGIAAGAARFLHAYEGAAVTSSALIPQWRRRIAGVFAFPPRGD